ncbi:MAG: protein kinase domain-containing protein [Planctomycetota bacterium]|jgi:serine/threonine-protein kinase
MDGEKTDVFGRLAVERELITQEQLDETLAAQKAGAEAMGVTVPLAQLFVSKGFLTKDQAQELLNAVAVETGEARLVAGYEVISKLGQGGMGAVYRAKQTESGRLVALKILPPSLANEGLVARFKREAEITAKLDHANIVRCVEFGFDKRRKCHFCALELVEGEDLAKRIAREGSLAEAEAVSVTRQVADALQHAFQNGLIHRDVKPENIMVTPDGTAKLLDLGLARAASAEATRLTQTGMFVVSAYYASPEQALGEKELDTRSDIYSLGCTLYHMLTGKPPFGGTTVMQILQKHVSDKLPWPADVDPDIPQGLCRVIARMMAKSPDDRYQTPLHVLADIDLLKGGGEPEVSEEVLAKSSIAPALGAGDGELRIAPESRAAGPALAPSLAATPERPPRKASSRPRRGRARDRAAPAPAADGAPVGGLSMGAKVGIGAGVAVVLVVGLVMFLGGKKEPKPATPSDKTAGEGTPAPAGPSQEIPDAESGSAPKTSAEATRSAAREPAAREATAPEPVAVSGEAAAPDDAAAERTTEPVAPVEPTAPGVDVTEPVRPAADRPRGVPADAVEFGGHRYKLFSTRMSWDDAKAFCERAGGHLATIASKEEQDFVVGVARGAVPDMGKWIGLTDDGHEGRWEWVTGEGCAFTAWADGEPSGTFADAGESWVALWQNRDYRWNDAPRDLAIPFICEWEPAGAAAAAAVGDVSADVGLARGLVAHWKFDEAEGTVARDSSGKGNDGTLVGNANWTGSRGGRMGGACRLGVDGHIATSIPGPHRTDLTWSAWIKTTSVDGTFLVNTNGSWRAGGKCLSVSGGNLKPNVCSVGDPDTGFVVNDGAWHHVALALVYSGRGRDAFSVYGDGTERIRSAWDFYRYNGTSLMMRIGHVADMVGGFEGLIDDVRIYDRALSAEEVALLADPERLAAIGQARVAKSEADEKLAALLAEFDALVGKGDIAGARDLASREARKRGNRPHADALRSASRVAGELAKRRDAMREAAGKLVGKQGEFVTSKGKLAGKVGRVTDEGIVLEIKKMMRGMGTIETKMTIKWAELDPKDEARLAKGWKPEGPDAHVAMAALALARKDAAAAGKALASAGGHPLAAHYGARLGGGPKPEAVVGRPAGGWPPDIKTVKKLFRGKVLKWDPKTLRVEFAYDFSNEEQAADWQAPQNSPTVAGRGCR